MTSSNGDGSGAPGFGPFDSLRSITDLQRQGIRAASQMAERFTQMLESGASGAPWWSPPNDAADGGSTAREDAGTEVVGEMRANMGRLLDLYGRLFEQTFDAYAALLQSRPAGDGPQMDAGATERVTLETTAGHTGTGELWLHNYSENSHPSLSLRVADLASGHGSVIDAHWIALDPAETPELAPGGTTRIGVAVSPPPTTPAGSYHGLILAAELPEQALPLAVQVNAASGHSTGAATP